MDEIKYLSDLVFCPRNPAKRKALDEYRAKYEAEHGPTDLTRRYTTMWPDIEQNWLMKHYPDRYIEGLPPFAHSFMMKTLESSAKEGRLEEWPEKFVAYYIRKRMGRKNDSGPQR